MKKQLMTLALIAVMSACLTGCAAGSATAGYSMYARSADGLSTEAEDKIVQRAKDATIHELMCKGMIASPGQAQH